MIYQRRNRNQCWCTGVSHAVSNIATPKFQCFSIICLIRYAMLGYLLWQIRLKLAANLLKCEHEDLSTTLRDPRVLEELLCRKLWGTVVMFSPDWEEWLDLVNAQAFQSSFPIPPVNVCFPGISHSEMLNLGHKWSWSCMQPGDRRRPANKFHIWWDVSHTSDAIQPGKQMDYSRIAESLLGPHSHPELCVTGFSGRSSGHAIY